MSDTEITSDVGDDALSGNDTSEVLSENECMAAKDSDSDASVEWKNMDHDESAWERLIVDAINYTPEFSVKFEEYQAAGENAKNAYKFAYKDVKPAIVKTMRKLFKPRLLFKFQFEHSKFHDTFMKDIDFFEEEGYTLEKAVSYAIKRNRHVFKEMLSKLQTLDSSSDSSDDE